MYIAKNIISIDKLILFTRFGMFNQQGSTHGITLCLQKSLRSKYLKLTLKQENFHEIDVEGNKKKGDNFL